MGTIFKDKLDRPFETMQAYEKILEMAPNNIQVRTFMERLSRKKFLSQVKRMLRQALWSL
jgi:hypothetical protein